MDMLTFVAELVKALAWPVTVLVIFLAIRRPLLDLIPLLRRLRYKGIELDFDRQIQELAVELRQELPAGFGVEGTGEPFIEHMVELSQLSPRAVVPESWLRLEYAAMQASKRHGLELTSRELKTPLLLGEALENAGILNERTLAIYHRLRNLRNAAAHASDFSFDPDSALEYADLALRLADYLNEI